MKIMIVDDDTTSLRILGAVLASQGHQVIERDTAIGTTLAIIREKPEVVILDVRMPGLAGDKLAALIDQETRGRPIVIFHSSLPSNELETLVQACGAAGFVTKGAGPTSFLWKFESVVAEARRSGNRKQS